jgi:outer membrane protein OmpA-like peptidoglycan-associated protein
MQKGVAFVTCLRALPWVLALGACSTPPAPPGVDESRRRPVNARAEVELQVCANELHNTRMQQAQAERRAQAVSATLAALAAHQQALAAARTTTAATAIANRVFTVHFGFEDAKLAVPNDIGEVLKAAARAAPLVVLRGRTDGISDTPAERHIAQARAVAVRDYLVAAGVDPARIRATYQPSGDPIADNASSAGRQLNRRVEIELYGMRPVPFDPPPATRP